ncbi:EamA family transporter, partial [Salmonella enterica subsp. enterica serovar Haifa]|nr:EamA family transporter [Salmonella enterica subsp. enterica serovar Haifa]
MTPHSGFSRRGWLLFAVMALLWGVPYLFISVAVESISPPAIVAGRTLLAALLLLPFALRSGALRAALRHWPWV